MGYKSRLEAASCGIMSTNKYCCQKGATNTLWLVTNLLRRLDTMDTLPPYAHNSKHTPIPGIYAITNTVNGKQYIGRAVDVQQRWYRHKLHLAKGIHHSPSLQRAWDKYGPDAFDFILLEQVSVRADLPSREQYYFDTLKPEYNILPEASSWMGMKHPEESKASMRGIKHKMPENFGQTMSAINKGKKKPEGFADAVGKRVKGRKHTEEAKEKNRLAHLGKPLSEEARANMSKAQKGRKHKPETIAKITSHHIGAKRSPEAIENIRRGVLDSIARRKTDEA